MAEIIEVANNAYEERDRAKEQIENLKAQEQREAGDFNNDLKELSHLIERHRKVGEYTKMNEMKDDGINQNEMADERGLIKPKTLK